MTKWQDPDPGADPGADPCLCLMDPDPDSDSDPALFVIELRDASKRIKY
jgi:hypothetical protein